MLPLFKLKNKISKKCRFDIGSYFTPSSVFEGNNYIGERTRMFGSYMGKGSYVANDSYIFNTQIGKYASIGEDVRIIAGQHPIKDTVSTHPSFYSDGGETGLDYGIRTSYDEFKYADKDNGFSVVIGNDVWIGSGVRILEGVNIGDGAVIGACSLVTKDVPPYEIWYGHPAEKKKVRFDTETVEKLLANKWWNNSDEKIKELAQENVARIK